MKTSGSWGSARRRAATSFVSWLLAAQEAQQRRHNPLPCLLALIVLWPLAAAFGVEGPPLPGGAGTTNILLSSWSFSDTNWLSDQGFPPISSTNLNLSDLGNGNALVVDSQDPAWLHTTW